MGKTFVSDLKAGLPVDSHYLVARKQLLPFRDPSRGQYLSLTLADRTGRVEAKLWDRAGEVDALVEVENIVRVAGTVEEYRGSLQLSISDIAVVPDDSVDLGDIVPTAPKDMEVMKRELARAVEGTGDRMLRAFLSDWFADPDFYRAFVTAPAAKHIHHAYLGGLLEHSLEVHRLCLAVAEMYPRVDRDLLAVASILHDVGKVEEYRYRRSIDLTDHGRLLGHTVIGWEMIRERARLQEGLSENTILHLGHLVLTHHGEMEFGAPVLPQTIEATILHHCDLLSGRVKQYDQILDGQGEGDWTEWDRMLGRSLYRGFLSGRTQHDGACERKRVG